MSLFSCISALASELTIGSLEAAVHDPASLRSVLLIAGLHYGWSNKHFHEYEYTFHFHMVEAIRSINERLQDTSTRCFYDLVKLIATLCFVEVRPPCA